MRVDTITILKTEYEELIRDQELLNTLRAYGIDSWDGYDQVMGFLSSNTNNKNKSNVSII